MAINGARSALVAFLIIGSIGCQGIPQRYSIDDLSMRFCHPEMYIGRDDFAKENALLKMKELGILKRNETRAKITELLGQPEKIEETTGLDTTCEYNMNSTTLSIVYNSDNRAKKFLLTHDEGGPSPREW